MPIWAFGLFVSGGLCCVFGEEGFGFRIRADFHRLFYPLSVSLPSLFVAPKTAFGRCASRWSFWPRSANAGELYHQPMATSVLIPKPFIYKRKPPDVGKRTVVRGLLFLHLSRRNLTAVFLLKDSTPEDIEPSVKNAKPIFWSVPSRR
jgi:hypothetical protein